MRLGTRRPLHRQLRSNVGSYSEVHKRTFLMFRETVESRVYLRATATKEAGKDARISVGYRPRTPYLLSRLPTWSVQTSVKWSLTAVTHAGFGTGCCHERFTVAHQACSSDVLQFLESSHPFPQRRGPQGCTQPVRTVGNKLSNAPTPPK